MKLGSNFEGLKQYGSLLRPVHWSKSFFVLIGVFYAHASAYVPLALGATFAFCLISSAVYIYNDIEDRSEDSAHPHKCQRPLASDQVSVSDAVILMLGLLILGLLLGWMISRPLAWILCVYLVINLAYNHVLKLIPVCDVLCIALGFMLRILAGTVGVGLAISFWLTLAATLLSLFIALNKRQLELQLGLKQVTRKVLQRYAPQVLQKLIWLTGASCFAVYLFYVFYVRGQSFYFVLTLPFSAFALWRFGWLSVQDVGNDDPVTVFLNDRLSRFNLYCFVVLTSMALTR